MQTQISGGRKVGIFSPDLKFGLKIANCMKRRDASIEICVFRSLDELAFLGSLEEFTGFVIQASCEPVTGLEIADYVSTFFKNRPVVFVRDGSIRGWEDIIKPASVKTVIWMQEGPRRIASIAARFIGPGSPQPA